MLAFLVDDQTARLLPISTLDGFPDCFCRTKPLRGGVPLSGELRTEAYPVQFFPPPTTPPTPPIIEPEIGSLFCTCSKLFSRVFPPRLNSFDRLFPYDEKDVLPSAGVVYRTFRSVPLSDEATLSEGGPLHNGRRLLFKSDDFRYENPREVPDARRSR